VGEEGLVTCRNPSTCCMYASQSIGVSGASISHADFQADHLWFHALALRQPWQHAPATGTSVSTNAKAGKVGHLQGTREMMRRHSAASAQSSAAATASAACVSSGEFRRRQTPRARASSEGEPPDGAMTLGRLWPSLMGCAKVPRRGQRWLYVELSPQP